MIGYLKGQISHLFTDFCFIDVSGVGYRVFVPLSTLQKLSVGLKITLFTSLQVREDAMLLYGFMTQAEYDLFLQLTSVSGIGPKVALSVLSVMRPEEFQVAVSQKNIALLTKIPGIGKKTAERMILELKDKLGAIDGMAEAVFSAADQINTDQMSEALAALVVLGYSQSESVNALKKIEYSDLPVGELIKRALKELARR